MLFSWILLTGIYHHMSFHLGTVSCFCLEMFNWVRETVHYQIAQCFSIFLFSIFLWEWQRCFKLSFYIVCTVEVMFVNFCSNFKHLFRLYVFVLSLQICSVSSCSYQGVTKSELWKCIIAFCSLSWKTKVKFRHTFHMFFQLIRHFPKS